MPDTYQPSAGALHALGGAALFVIGAFFLANRIEAPTLTLLLAAACFASGGYLLLAGAIARGIQMARRARSRP